MVLAQRAAVLDRTVELALGTSHSMAGLETFTGTMPLEIILDLHQQPWQNSASPTWLQRVNGTWISSILVSFLLAALDQSVAMTAVGVIQDKTDTTSEW
jgi:hypothetical protein